MKQTKAYYRNLTGTNYEIGVALASWMQTRPGMLDRLLLPPGVYPEHKLDTLSKLLDEYAPGINEEIHGFADRLGVKPSQVLYYAMSYVEHGCSLMASLAEKNVEDHSLLACTYDFSDQLEDLCLTSTKVDGKYTHISTLGNTFGRTNGMNEHGLAICQSCNGIPVGNFEGAAKAGVSGLLFWTVIRSLLENCRDIGEALNSLAAMPIGFNLNLMMADASGEIALFQCLNGQKAHKVLTPGDAQTHLSATNHTVLPELEGLEKMKIESSLIRRSLIEQTFDQNEKTSKETFRKLISTKYPDGLCCHYYEGFFGLLHAVIFDVQHKTLEIVFGSPQNNPWRTFSLADTCKDRAFEAVLPYEDAPASFYTMVECK